PPLSRSLRQDGGVDFAFRIPTKSKAPHSRAEGHSVIFLHANRLLARDPHRCKPVEPVGLFSADNAKEFALQSSSNGDDVAITYGNPVDRSNGSDLGGRAR